MLMAYQRYDTNTNKGITFLPLVRIVARLLYGSHKVKAVISLMHDDEPE
jgi:hypothetical protein